MAHVPLSVLLDHVIKVETLDADSLEHVNSCPHCRSDIRWLEQLGILHKFEPPKSAVETVIKAFKDKNEAA